MHLMCYTCSHVTYRIIAMKWTNRNVLLPTAEIENQAHLWQVKLNPKTNKFVTRPQFADQVWEECMKLIFKAIAIIHKNW